MTSCFDMTLLKDTFVRALSTCPTNCWLFESEYAELPFRMATSAIG